jgi:hypothetical protein
MLTTEVSDGAKLLAVAAAGAGCAILCLAEPETVGSTMR